MAAGNPERVVSFDHFRRLREQAAAVSAPLEASQLALPLDDAIAATVSLTPRHPELTERQVAHRRAMLANMTRQVVGS